MPDLRAGGGGGPSAALSTMNVNTLGPEVLKHLRLIFNEVSRSDHDGIDETRARMFIQDTQKEYDSDARRMFVDLNGLIAFNDFLNYVTSPAFNALGSSKELDASYPLSHYFISSSHNTYLMGHQLYGQCSVDGYTNVRGITLQPTLFVSPAKPG